MSLVIAAEAIIKHRYKIMESREHVELQSRTIGNGFLVMMECYHLSFLESTSSEWRVVTHSVVTNLMTTIPLPHSSSSSQHKHISSS
jgi:hypothetical protein